MFYKISKKEVTLPVISFVLITVLILAIWNELIKSHKQAIHRNLAHTGKSVSREFSLIFEQDIESIENLKMRLEYTDGKNFQYWQEDAQLLLEQNPCFHFIEWIDSTMVIKSIVPLMGNESALNLDISKVDYRKKEWIEHSLDNTTNITSWTNMRQGGQAFLIDVPVYFQNKFQGTISAGLDFRESLSRITENKDEYQIEMSDSDGTVFYTYNKQDIVKRSNGLVYEEKILIDKLHSKYWILKMYPSQSSILADGLNLINLYVLIGFVLDLLICLLIHFCIKAEVRTKRAIRYSMALSKSNQNLKREKNRAEKATKAKSEFLSNMSHEIRTPLHAILGFVQIIKGSKLNEADKVYVDLLDKSSSSLLSIVDDILVIDRIEKGCIQLENIRFNPSQKINELIDTYKHLFYDKDLYVNSKFKEPFGANVIGDPNKLSQIIINILKNASKFTVKGGVIISYAEEQIDNQLKVKITIEDSGKGIPKYKVHTIFNRFMQLDSCLKKQHEGSGLGLAISKDLARMMGGFIKVYSVLNQGSKFEVSVVFEMAEKQDMYILNRNHVNMDFSYLDILIVDDNKINIVILKKILEDSNIKVDIAMNGKIAVNKVETKKYDIVFMDIHMPIMDGYQATHLIRKFDTDIAIFGLSANVTPEANTKALESGMNDYLTKPFTKDQLYKLLLPVLDHDKLKAKTDLHNKDKTKRIMGLMDHCLLPAKNGLEICK
ncbi:response regulator [Mariniflexile sp. HMF6888]|uniref:response regulator n=1 Tax=Mariniflexile sp. HMF6888 TaxID=3373086 RepID=UPI0037BAB177